MGTFLPLPLAIYFGVGLVLLAITVCIRPEAVRPPALPGGRPMTPALLSAALIVAAAVTWPWPVLTSVCRALRRR